MKDTKMIIRVEQGYLRTEHISFIRVTARIPDIMGFTTNLSPLSAIAVVMIGGETLHFTGTNLCETIVDAFLNDRGTDNV